MSALGKRCNSHRGGNWKQLLNTLSTTKREDDCRRKETREPPLAPRTPSAQSGRETKWGRWSSLGAPLGTFKEPHLRRLLPPHRCARDRSSNHPRPKQDCRSNRGTETITRIGVPQFVSCVYTALLP